MSRRKQQNPKPLKRNQESDLEEVADLLHLPSDVLTLKESRDSEADYTVWTQVALREGTLFGPFSAQVMKLPEGNGQAAILEVKSSASHQKVYVRIKDENGGWLKLVTTTPSPGDANANISVEGEEIWCGITKDLEPDTEIKLSDELRGTYRVIDSPNPSNTSDHGSPVEKKPPFLFAMRSSDAESGNSTEGSRSGSPETEGPKHRPDASTPLMDHCHRNDNDRSQAYDRDPRESVEHQREVPAGQEVVEGISVKREVVTPENCGPEYGEALIQDSHGDKDRYNALEAATPGRHMPHVLITVNGTAITAGASIKCGATGYPKEASTVPTELTGFTKTQDKRPGGAYVCVPCGIHFSNQDNLHAHQTIYCAHRVTKETTADEADDQSMVSPKSDSPDGSEKDASSKGAKNESTLSTGFSGSTLLPKKRQRQQSTNYNVESAEQGMASGEMSTQQQGDKKVLKIGKVYRCPYCSYTSEKKSSLSRHLRMHGSPPPQAAGESVAPVHDVAMATPPMARYCSNCDIQFSSIRTFQVHKQFYCNTRHVQKSSVTSASTAVEPGSPVDVPGQEIPVEPDPRYIPQNPSTDKELPGSSAPAGTLPSSILLQQPVYAAISTNPLILVPCHILPNGSLVPAAGIAPSGNLLLPSTTGTAVASESGAVSAVNPIRPLNSLPSLYGATAETATHATAAPINGLISGHGHHKMEKTTRDHQQSKSSSPPSTSEGNSNSKPSLSPSSSDVEKPLDLSVKKPSSKSPDSAERAPKRHRHSPTDKVPKGEPSVDENISAMEAAKVLTSASAGGSIVIPPGSVVPTGLPAGVALPPGAIPSQVAGIPVLNADGVITQVQPPEVLVKQGTSKCKECNIVFYKYENYIAHKRHYCASRQQRMLSRIAASPPAAEKPGKDDTSGKEDSCDGLKSSSSPIPGVNNTVLLASAHSAVSPNGSGSSNSHSPPLPQPVFQFYCVACGIKFTSLDNLQAHQTYYCPKREILKVPTQGAGASGAGTTHKLTEFRCSKCKNSFATEEALKTHPCVIHRKCPYCDVTCPTLSAAQRHLVTHTGIHAFKCTICGYKGHTLRGMRTHIRIHLDKTNGAPEESFIACVDEEGSTVSPFGGRKRKNSDKGREDHGSSTSAASPGEVPPTVVPLVGVTVGDPTANMASSSGESCDGKSDPNLPPDSGAENMTIGEAIHWCQLCGYSSNYKGNVARHIKLVHKELSSQHALSAVQTSSWLPLSTSSSQPRAPAPEASPEASTSVAVKVCVSPPLSETCGPQDSMDSTVSRPDQANARGQEMTSTSAANSEGEAAANCSGAETNSNVPKKGGPRYCKSCDITFKYLANFIAHKKHYCSSHNTSVTLPASDST